MQMHTAAMKNEFLNLIKKILEAIDCKAQMLDCKVQIASIQPLSSWFIASL